MREIRFRAWDKIEKKMSESFTFSDCYNMGIGEGVRVHQTFYLGWCDIMQFTGLKDKNGKEIYEGDILRSIHNRDVYDDVIVWRDFSWYGKLLNAEPLEMTPLTDFNESKCEIIGNIYENPELLKP